MARIERTVGRGRRLIASVTATAMLTGGLVVTSAAVAMPAGADAPSCKAAGKPTSAQLNSTTGITKTSVSVGNISIITGPVPGLFQGAAYGAQAYFDYINSQGGVNGRKIDYHSYDDAFSGTTNQSLATQAVSKDFALAGSFSLFDSFSCNVLASNPAMPDVSVTLDSATNSLANVFSPQPLGSGGSEAGYRYLKSKYPNAVKAVGNLYSNVDTAIAQWHGQEALMKHVGYKIAYQRAVSPVETNFAADVVNFKKNHVQFVFITDGTAQIYAALVKEMRTQNFKPQVIMSAGPIYTPDFVTQAYQFACPVMRAATGFHRDHARLTGGKKLCHLFALELPPMNLARFHVYPMQLKKSLCNIQSECRNLHVEPSLPFVVVCNTTTLALRCRQVKRGLPAFLRPHSPGGREASITSS